MQKALIRAIGLLPVKNSPEAILIMDISLTGGAGMTGETGISTGIPGETESERIARIERERQMGMPRDRI